MTSKDSEKEIDYVSKQANLTAQIESERQAAKKWWDEYGMCYLENARPEDFTYDNRVLALKKKLEDPKFHHAALHTTSTDYGCRPPFKECRKKI
ncbi:succinyl CoA transferase [Phytophthora cinnamomi]|uniref:succinyl CoA transferase n=1 Tax=Phytophthora cinnamomi TaxID=4785 RepID=UPI00355A1BDC|nr:succinyl CoA transferase [Phytophthora cinnamomi]KAG6615539.1 succinyl CoA transferase [Phytophthora cinnamomi]